MNIKYKILLLILTITFYFSCNLSDNKDIHNPVGNIIFFNGLAETLSVLDIVEEKIYNDQVVTGVWPNHILYDDNLYLINSGSNSLEIYDISTLSKIGEIYLGTNTNPWMIFKKSGENKAYITCYYSNSIKVVNLEALEVTSTISVETNPEGGVIAGDYLYIGNTNDDTISVINMISDSLETTITLPSTDGVENLNPQSIIYIEELNELHIVCTGNNPLTGSGSEGSIMIYNINSQSFTETISIGGSPVYFEGGTNTTDKIVYLGGSSGLLAYNYETRGIISTGIIDNISGIYYLPESDKIYLSLFNDDKIDIYYGDDYSFEKSLTASDGPQQLLYIKE